MDPDRNRNDSPRLIFRGRVPLSDDVRDMVLSVPSERLDRDW